MAKGGNRSSGTIIDLDFSLLPKIDSAHTRVALNDQVLERLTFLPRIKSRIQNSIKFAWWCGTHEDNLACPPEAVPRLREGFWRAALSELVSVEDIMGMDLRDQMSDCSVYRLNDSRRPHLHLIRELRNLQLHLTHNRLGSKSSDFIWADRPISVTLWILEGITYESIKTLKNANRYKSEHLIKVVDWFNATQNEWGILELFIRTVEDYSTEIYDHIFVDKPATKR